MIRLKYNPDGWVLINTKYNCTFETFDSHCNIIGLDNPFKKGEFCLYTKRGLELIGDDGIHSTPDGVVNSAMDAIIAMVKMFTKEALKTEKAERIAFEDSLPLKERRRLNYIRQTPIDEQLEAIIDFIYGREEKLNQIKATHNKIKLDVK